MDAFQEPGFQDTISHTLAKMSHQRAVDTRPKAKKAGRLHDEDRDTTHPKMVTELFMGFLAAVGEPVDVPRIWKNTRDEVMWLDSLLPWRRLPLWMLVRVALQLSFTRPEAASGTTPEAQMDLYKSFMLFHMARILELSSTNGLRSEMLYMMNAKLTRRLLKLDPPFGAPGIDFVRNAMSTTQLVIENTWSRTMDRVTPRFDLRSIGNLEFEKDITAHLPAVDGCITSMAQRKNTTASFDFKPTSSLVKYRCDNLPTSVEFSTGTYRKFNLMAFEDWVATNLTSWIKFHKTNVGTCGKLGDLIKDYHNAAHSLYEGNPELTSIMLLTILELWIASDESATYTCSLLLDYYPSVPKDLVQSLILPFRDQMERLGRAEEYLRCRSSRAKFRGEGILEDFGTPTSFPVRYFDQSREHKDLLNKVEALATRQREEKCRKLLQQKSQYNEWMRLYDQEQCEYYSELHPDPSLQGRHRRACRRCGYESRATALTIEVHEWPLPRLASEAKAVVFELRLPPFFGHWRDTTILLIGVFGGGYHIQVTPRKSFRLDSYSGLSSFFDPFSQGQRIGLLSQDKPHAVTHRRNQPVSTASEDTVCLENGLRYQYYDNTAGSFVTSVRFEDTIPEACTYQLPSRSASLQQFLFRPSRNASGCTPNTVIASLSDCPEHLTLDEYQALSSIPLGHRIQWQNILRQLFAPSVNFARVETGLVILQAIYQAGPGEEDNTLREGHGIVNNEEFASALLRGLGEATKRMEENWESSQSLSTFVSLATRLLSLTAADTIKGMCLRYLSRARTIAFGWVNLIREKANRVTKDAKKNLHCKAIEIALICVDSFNVDALYLNDVLATPADASVLIRSCVIIQEGRRSISTTFDSVIPLLLRRQESVSYRSSSILAAEILDKGNSALDNAISQTWSAYQAGGTWKPALGHEYWLTSKMDPVGRGEILNIYFNLLTSELLVNGLPLDRLPSEYEGHSIYSTLFGDATLEVMPTAIPGMQFSGKEAYLGYTLHFGLGESPAPGYTECDLLVQAIQGGQTYELVPRHILHGDFPSAFIDEFVHWYSVTEECLEFRPLRDSWIPSPENWRLTRAGTNWRLVKDDVSLVYTRSTTAKVLSSIFDCLEDPLHAHIMLNHSLSSIEVELPRLQLGFYLRQGDLSIQSRQFRGMSIDQNQSLGTLIGLHSRLILKSNQSGARLLLVPERLASYVEDGDHVHVTIEKNSASRAHAYHIDDQIRRLVDNGSLPSKLFLSYLHALTAFCLPDPLTGRTGTEQALSILSSAAVRSFDHLSLENVLLLDKIAHLTPGRCCYPEGKRTMQSVLWSPGLSVLSQHGRFYKCVKSILDQARGAEIFHRNSQIPHPSLKFVDSLLLERDNIRSSTFRVWGFGAGAHTITCDELYKARDGNQSSVNSVDALTMARMVYKGSISLPYSIPAGLKFGEDLWEFLSQRSEVLGRSHGLPLTELQYDAGLLMEPSKFISDRWIPLHMYLSKAVPQTEKFRIMIWFSTLAFAADANQKVIQTIASFVTISAMIDVSPPSADIFQLYHGRCANRSDLHATLQQAVRGFGSSPEANLTRDRRESTSSFNRRRERLYKSSRDCALNGFVDRLVVQWPCEVPAAPVGPADDSFRKYIDVRKAMGMVRTKFKTWFDNWLFNEYLNHIAETLTRVPSGSSAPLPRSFARPEWNPEWRRGFVHIDDVFAGPAPPLPTRKGSLGLLPSSNWVSTSTLQPRLAMLLTRLESQANVGYERSYVEDLRKSLLSLHKEGKDDYVLSSASNDTHVVEHLRICKERVSEIYSTILAATTATSLDLVGSTRPKYFATASKTQQSPRLSPVFLLQQLGRHRWNKISPNWQKCIIHYALALSDLQRAERLTMATGNSTEFLKELRNVGHTNWDPFEHPESLLLEVESGIIVREQQEQIARQMRAPDSNQNVVMQLNMGEGKSSVIVPIVAAALADGTRLVRVVVAKPQSKQMFQMLLSKLGGLLDRRIYHVPFSRDLRFGVEDAEAVSRICRECMKNGGIMLVQPEHILSFKLMGLESMILGKEQIGRALLSTQDFFDESSRDIVDESDENFSVKFELIYTMGMQRWIEFSPDRWILIQQVLNLVREYAPHVRRELPLSIEVDQRQQGRFPRTRILRQDAQELIFKRVAEHICDNGLGGFPIARRSREVREAVLKYMTQPDLRQDEIDRVEKRGPEGFWSDATKTSLLLLRGLLAGGVLAFSFGQKRWRVNYGLDTLRRPSTKLVVPYRAKDCPAPRSEFSHPDVVIVLTCLTYYYSGLKIDDLLLAFDHIVRSDQADLEYQTWVKDAPDLPPAFHQLAGINVKDGFQFVNQVFPLLRFSKGAIDYFLSHMVFPKEMKEFPHKLSSSGWDIGRIKAHPTTGFSGTNDSRQVLPLSMKQLDLPEQSHTNALVLEYLLQVENSVALMEPRDETAGSDAEVLLTMVTNLDQPTRVILDVGAQILELQNIEVAEQWLKIMPEQGTQAVVYFNEADELSVLDRKGQVELLQTSSYSGQLDLCLVFLDEAHTRGTDLRLPDNYRAAVTLGANLTKDRLVQGMSGQQLCCATHD